MRGKVTIVACPKLDPVNYLKKLTEVIRENDIKSVTIVLQSECESSARANFQRNTLAFRRDLKAA